MAHFKCRQGRGGRRNAATPYTGYLRKITPPSFTENHFFQIDYRIEEAIRERRGRGDTLQVQAGVTIIDNLGIVACVIVKGRRFVYGSLFVHGRMVTKEPSVYLSESAILHASRATHGYLHATERNRKGITKICNRAGDWEAIKAMKEWFRTGELMLQSQVAPALAEEIDTLEDWLTTDMYLGPFYLLAGTDASGGP